MNLSLYEIANEYQSAMLKLMDSDLDEQTITDTLEGMSGELEAKATNVAAFIRNLEASAESIKQAEKQMADRRKAIEAKSDRIKAYLLENMIRCDMTKIECPYFTLSVRQNPVSVIIDDAGLIPSELYVYPEAPAPYPDKKGIKAAIESGQAIEGAHLERGVRLEIR